MQQANIRSDVYTFTAVLKACASTASIEEGKLIHAHLVSSGLKIDLVLGNTLVDMYAKCGSIDNARQVFSEMPAKDVVSWTSLISGCVQNERGLEALSLFRQMQEEGVIPDRYTYVSILKACGIVGALDQGKLIHSQLLEQGFQVESYLGNTLIDMYAKCGSIGEAYQLFMQLPERDLVSWNTVIAGCALHGRGQKALDLFKMMQVEGQQPDKITYVSILKACGSLKALDQGKLIHRQLIEGGFILDLNLGNSLIDMYSKCGSLDEARELFLQLPYRDVVSWTAMMDGCIQHGHAHEAFKLLKEMQKKGLEPDKFTFASILKACSSPKALNQGRLIHTQLRDSGLKLDVFLGNSLLDMYVKCGSIDEAYQLFGKLVKRDVVTWNTMIAGCAQYGQGQLALHLYEKMQKEGIVPNRVTFVSILKVCGILGVLDLGKVIHSQIMKNGLEFDAIIGNSLIGMYGKCGCIEEAHKVFLKLPIHDVITWTALMDGYIQQGQAHKALGLFEEMEREGTKPDRITWLSILRACGNIGSVDRGKFIHMELMKNGLDQEISIGNALIDMYAKCGKISEGHSVFLNMSKRDEVSWNTMITACAQQGDVQEAFHFFKKMQEEGVEPGIVAYISVLRACGKIGALKDGQLIHAQLVGSGMDWDINLGNALLDMYMKCGEVNNACQEFLQMPERNVISWTTLVDGCAQNGHTQMAFTLFEKMQKEGLKLDRVAFASILKMCASTGKLDQGKLIHEQLIKCGLKWDAFLGSTLVDMYARCGDVDQAHKVFFQLPERDLISYNAIITGCASHGHGDKALILFDKMKDEGLHPDKVTFVSVLKACGNLGTLQRGKLIHAQVMERGCELDPVLGNALVDMYAKSGSIADARQLFLNLPERDVISWTAIIDGCAQQGHGQEALSLFEQMQEEGVRPNSVTLRCVLSACSHAGLVDEGCHIFQCMHEIHGIRPMLEHYACVVDLLGRAGYLYEAYDFISKMPLQPNAALWMSFLGSCRTHGNLELGLVSFKAILKLDPTDAAAYILMSSIYAAVGRSKYERDYEVKKRTNRNLKI
ncbi:hypothetical protein O6H91_21G058700 [Diphasiastrum complanatum]|nr:hypothetical protein O6H91_21G058700 [Diphasiastrum complanatum]